MGNGFGNLHTHQDHQIFFHFYRQCSSFNRRDIIDTFHFFQRLFDFLIIRSDFEVPECENALTIDVVYIFVGEIVKHFLWEKSNLLKAGIFFQLAVDDPSRCQSILFSVNTAVSQS